MKNIILLGSFSLCLLAINVHAWDLVCFAERSPFIGLNASEYYFTFGDAGATMEMRRIGERAHANKLVNFRNCRRDDSGAETESKHFLCEDYTLNLDTINGTGTVTYDNQNQLLLCRDKQDLIIMQ